MTHSDEVLLVAGVKGLLETAWGWMTLALVLPSSAASCVFSEIPTLDPDPFFILPLELEDFCRQHNRRFCIPPYDTSTRYQLNLTFSLNGCIMSSAWSSLKYSRIVNVQVTMAFIEAKIALALVCWFLFYSHYPLSGMSTVNHYSYAAEWIFCTMSATMVEALLQTLSPQTKRKHRRNANLFNSNSRRIQQLLRAHLLTLNIWKLFETAPFGYWSITQQTGV